MSEKADDINALIRTVISHSNEGNLTWCVRRLREHISQAVDSDPVIFEEARYDLQFLNSLVHCSDSEVTEDVWNRLVELSALYSPGCVSGVPSGSPQVVEFKREYPFAQSQHSHIFIRVADAVLPARVANEVLGDLVEAREDRIQRGQSRWLVAVWLLVQVCWTIYGCVRHPPQHGRERRER